ncbi:MAG: 16S rRNA (guanine(1207)-N(2))-methyltransferase RsmC [Enterobacteriaceae bacterium]
MSQLMPVSEILLRHHERFQNRQVVLAGDLQDQLARELPDTTRVWCGYYQQWRQQSAFLQQRAWFGLLVPPEWLQQCNSAVYFWPKNKQEAQFQLRYLLSVLPVGCELWVVGENRSGVRSVDTLMADLCTLQKIDTARRCSLYFTVTEQPAAFSAEPWWHRYQYEGVEVHALPGVFSQQGLDNGSQLLLSTLEQPVVGEVLDMGCGAGVLAAVVAKRASEPLKLTLSDISAAAIASSQATLQANGLEGRIIASDGFSDIQGSFDLILSNPPFHEGLKTSLEMTQQFITGAAQHLRPGGELRIVANAFLPYAQWLDQSFGKHQVLTRNGKFKVYSARKGRG